jgi:transposase
MVDGGQIVAESYSGADSVSRIARRYGLLPQQLFTWRRETRRSATPPAFAAVALAPVAKARQAALPAKPCRSGSAKRKMVSKVAVEITAGGITVRVRRGADSSMVGAIVRALQAAS